MQKQQGFLLASVLTGCLAILALVIIPGEREAHTLLGFSASRWLLILWVTAGVFVLSTLLYVQQRMPGRAALLNDTLERSLSGWKVGFACFACGFGVLAGLLFLSTIFTLTNKQVIPLFIRLSPVILWCSFLCLELLIYLIWRARRGERPSLAEIVRNAYQALWRRRSDLAFVFILSAAILIVFAPVYQIVGHTSGSDYLAHVRQAQRMDATGVNESSYFLYQGFVIAFHRLFPQEDYLSAGVWVVVLFQVFLGWVLYALLRWSLRRAFESQPVWACALSAAASLGLLLITPLTVFTWKTQNLYFGYIGINVYHNPTSVLLKPLALLLFLSGVAIFSAGDNKRGDESRSTIPFWLTGAITVLCGLAKPNYIICFLPALAAYALLWLRAKKKIDWLGLAGGIGLPAVGLLAWQYLATYSHARVIVDEAGIIFAPFLVYGRESHDLLLKFIFSIAFPLTVYLLYSRRARQDWSLNLAWLTFALGAIFTYFFAESGQRLQDANFAWSGQVTLFILYAVSAAFFLSQAFDRRSSNRWREKLVPFLISCSIFGLQVACGILWISQHLTQPGNIWW